MERHSASGQGWGRLKPKVRPQEPDAKEIGAEETGTGAEFRTSGDCGIGCCCGISVLRNWASWTPAGPPRGYKVLQQEEHLWDRQNRDLPRSPLTKIHLIKSVVPNIADVNWWWRLWISFLIGPSGDTGVASSPDTYQYTETSLPHDI